MRAVQDPPRPRTQPRFSWPHLRRGKAPLREPPRPLAPAAEKRTRGGAFWWLGTAFLLGYLPGVLAVQALPQEWQAAGQALAGGSPDAAAYADFSALFAARAGAAFLQAAVIVLCGFCAFGAALLTIIFAIRGAFFGFCAAQAYLAGGARGLIVHWLLVSLPDLACLLLLLWLAGYAVRLGMGLYAAAFGGPPRREALAAAARRLLVRFLLAGAALCVLSAVGAFVGGLLAGALL